MLEINGDRLRRLAFILEKILSRKINIEEYSVIGVNLSNEDTLFAQVKITSLKRTNHAIYKYLPDITLASFTEKLVCCHFE